MRKSSSGISPMLVAISLCALLALGLPATASAAPLEEEVFGIVNSVAAAGCSATFSGPSKVIRSPVSTIDGQFRFTCNRAYSLIGGAVCVEVQDPVWIQVGCGSSLATNSDTATPGVSVPCVTIGPVKYRLVGVGVTLNGGSTLWRVLATTGSPATITCSSITPGEGDGEGP